MFFFLISLSLLSRTTAEFTWRVPKIQSATLKVVQNSSLSTQTTANDLPPNQINFNRKFLKSTNNALGSQHMVSGIIAADKTDKFLF